MIAITFEELIGLWFSMCPYCGLKICQCGASHRVWEVGKEVLPYLIKMKDVNGQYVCTPVPPDGWMLMGEPIVIVPGKQNITFNGKTVIVKK